MPTDPVPAAAANPPERIPIMQRILGNPFLLLFLGVTLPNVLYIPAVSCRSGSIPWFSRHFETQDASLHKAFGAYQH